MDKEDRDYYYKYEMSTFSNKAISESYDPGSTYKLISMAAILESNLGINPQTDGPLIRLPIPKLSEERRNELAKVVSQYAENSKIAIRNIRREIMDSIKKDEKDKNISQDEMKKKSSDVQKITDEYVSKIDLITSKKQTEILKV